MLTMQEINGLLKENFERQLASGTKLPEDLAAGFKAWVRGVVQAASQQLKAEQADAPTGNGQTEGEQ